MKLETKLEKANENIEILIGIIIGEEKIEKDGYCCGYSQEKGNCENTNCNKCRRLYFEEIEEAMLKRYLVK